MKEIEGQGIRDRVSRMTKGLYKTSINSLVVEFGGISLVIEFPSQARGIHFLLEILAQIALLMS